MIDLFYNTVAAGFSNLYRQIIVSYYLLQLFLKNFSLSHLLIFFFSFCILRKLRRESNKSAQTMGMLPDMASGSR